MQKFIVGINVRTGSTIYALWLNAARPDIAPDEVAAQISWSSNNETPDWSFPIQHTHQFEVFATAPPEFKRIWCRRNYLDSVLSHFVADHTNTYHLHNYNGSAEYQEKYQNTKFVIDLFDFHRELKDCNSRDRAVSQWQQQTHNDMIPLLYHVHAQNTQAFYNAVNLPTPEFIPDWPRPMSVNKYDLVENLSELLEVYQVYWHNYSDFDVDKDATVARISQYLRK
jgi:hypothetical protein